MLALLVVAGLGGPALADTLPHIGALRIDRPGKGRIDLNTGQASFTIKKWLWLVAADTDGVDPTTEQVTIGVSDEKFVLPIGSMKVSRNGRKFTYRENTDRGVQALKLVRDGNGDYQIKILKVAGVDLSTLVISDPPICLGVAVIVGNDDGFSGVYFDRPKPFPSKLLTLPGFCDATTDWPWL